MSNHYDVRRVIAIAKSEVGYLEKASNKDLDDKTANSGDKNYTKYARDIDAIKGWYNGRKQGITGWCDIFVDWCFIKAYGTNEGRELLCQPLSSCGAGPYYSLQYFKGKKRFHDTAPMAGDQIFFHPADGDKSKISHTGLVVDVSGTTITTVEGNTVSGGKQGVWTKTYKTTDARIAGYGRPDYGEPIIDDFDDDINEDDIEEDDTEGVLPGEPREIELHMGDSENADVEDVIHEGDTVELVAVVGNWLGVRRCDDILWMSADYLPLVKVEVYE